MAITNTKTDSGMQTVFDGTGASEELSGRHLVLHTVFAPGVGSIQPEIWLGGAWTPLSTAPLTKTEPYQDVTGRLQRDYRFRMNCTAFTSGTPTVHWDVGR